MRLPVQAFYVKKAVVPAVSQMAPAYAAGGGGAERLLGPYEVLDTHAEEVEVRTLVHLPYRFVPLALDQHLTPRAAWTVLGGAISSEEGAVETQCVPLLAFLCAAAVKGSVILFEASDLDVVTPDKALEAQRMDILRRYIPVLFDAEALGGASTGDAMMLALSAFEARTDMLDHTRSARNGDPRALRIKLRRRDGEQYWRERSACTDAWMRVDYRRCTPHSPLH